MGKYKNTVDKIIETEFRMFKYNTSIYRYTQLVMENIKNGTSIIQ